MTDYRNWSPTAGLNQPAEGGLRVQEITDEMRATKAAIAQGLVNAHSPAPASHETDDAGNSQYSIQVSDITELQAGFSALVRFDDASVGAAVMRLNSGAFALFRRGYDGQTGGNPGIQADTYRRVVWDNGVWLLDAAPTISDVRLGSDFVSAEAGRNVVLGSEQASTAIDENMTFIAVTERELVLYGAVSGRVVLTTEQGETPPRGWWILLANDSAGDVAVEIANQPAEPIALTIKRGERWRISWDHVNAVFVFNERRTDGADIAQGTVNKDRLPVEQNATDFLGDVALKGATAFGGPMELLRSGTNYNIARVLTSTDAPPTNDAAINVHDIWVQVFANGVRREICTAKGADNALTWRIMSDTRPPTKLWSGTISLDAVNRIATATLNQDRTDFSFLQIRQKRRAAFGVLTANFMQLISARIDIAESPSNPVQITGTIAAPATPPTYYFSGARDIVFEIHSGATTSHNPEVIWGIY